MFEQDSKSKELNDRFGLLGLGLDNTANAVTVADLDDLTLESGIFNVGAGTLNQIDGTGVLVVLRGGAG